MKVACLSDTHMYHDKIKIPECDLLLHAGDFTMRGSWTESINFAHWVQQQPARYKIVIPGNHDFAIQEDSVFAKKEFKDRGINLLVDEQIEIEGLKIYGSPWQPWFYNWAYNFPRQYSRYELLATSCWEMIPEDTNILVTHGPPKGILDLVARKVSPDEDPHVGCRFLLDRIQSLSQLKLHVFGHIHEAFGVQKINNVTFANVSSVTVKKSGLRLEPVVFDL